MRYIWRSGEGDARVLGGGTACTRRLYPFYPCLGFAGRQTIWDRGFLFFSRFQLPFPFRVILFLSLSELWTVVVGASPYPLLTFAPRIGARSQLSASSPFLVSWLHLCIVYLLCRTCFLFHWAGPCLYFTCEMLRLPFLLAARPYMASHCGRREYYMENITRKELRI